MPSEDQIVKAAQRSFEEDWDKYMLKEEMPAILAAERSTLLQEPRTPPKLKPSCLAILERLREAPATTHDLLNLTWQDQHGNQKRGMSRYGARLMELRAAGYKITSNMMRQGSCLYALVEK